MRSETLKTLNCKPLPLSPPIPHSGNANYAAVAADPGIQKYAAALVDPYGANLRAFSADNKLDTRQKLADLSGQIIAIRSAAGSLDPRP